jgi:MYXO-CTERM domain-containing protein
MLRNVLVLSVVALAANASWAQEACVPEEFELTCVNATTVEFCSAATQQTATADCTFPDQATGTAIVPGGTCGNFPCGNTEGDGCTAFGLDGVTCVAGAGDPCVGISPLLDNDPANDNETLGLPCGNQACVIGANAQNQLTETCVGGIPACTDFGVSCIGNTLSICLFGLSEDDNDNGVIDPGEDEDGDGQVDSLIITQPTGIDCAALGGTCSNTATDGPLHGLFGAGAAGQPIPDCILPAEGEGEGEGEGEADCTENSQCGRDRVCRNGVCVAANDDDDEDPPSCANANATVAPLGAMLVLLAPLVRRRRR